MLSWNQLQPDSASKSPQHIRAIRVRMATSPITVDPTLRVGPAPTRSVGSTVLFPSQQLEHFVLNALDVGLAEARVEDLESGPRRGALQQQVILAPFAAHILELQALAPQQQESEH